MKTHTLSILPLLPLAAMVSRLQAADYTANNGDALNGAIWTPNAGALISGSNITPLAGDRLIYDTAGVTTNQITNNWANIVINAGAEFVTTGGSDNNRAVRPHLFLAGTGTDGNGAFKNTGNSWVQVSDVNLTDNATILLQGGGWRHDNHGTGFNALNLAGKTLTVNGNAGVWLVNTVLTGGGVINANNTAEFNFEANAVLPADVTLNLGSGTLHSSWDGAGKIMAGPVNTSNNSTIEARFNDLQKTYTGLITLGAGNTNFRTSDSGGGGGSLKIDGQITGGGTLVKDGGASVDTGNTRGILLLNNGSNNYTGGTSINSGHIRIGANNAVSTAGPLTVNSGTTLDLNGFNQTMHSGSVNAGGNVSGNGDFSIMSGTIRGTISGGGKAIIAGPGVTNLSPAAAITKAGGMDLAGGTVVPLGNNALASVTGTVTVTGDTTIKPGNHGFAEFHDGTGADQGGANDVFTNRAFTGLPGQSQLGITNGIPAIDSTAKPFGDYNRYLYSGKIVNTTGANIDVTFGEQYDDQIRVEIDGSTVQLDGAWNAASASSLVSLTPGAHDIRISSFDGVGGAGPHSGWTKGVGIKLGGHTIADPNGGGDNAAFSVINIANLNSMGLDITAGDITESKDVTINAGQKLIVDTSNMLHGGSYTMSGVLSGGGGLEKTGSGTMTLTGVSTYSGQTLISAGTLKLGPAGSLNPSSVVTVASGATFDASAVVGGLVIPVGQTLDGNGTVVGNTTVNGTASPGNSIGTLNVTGSLTLNGTTNMELDSTGAPISDELNATGTLDYGGTLNVTLLSAPATLALGETFDLFDAPSFFDVFTTINLPDLSGLSGPNDPWYWQNNLNVDGSLTVLPEPSTAAFAALAGAALLRRRRR